MYRLHDRHPDGQAQQRLATRIPEQLTLDCWKRFVSHQCDSAEVFTVIMTLIELLMAHDGLDAGAMMVVLCKGMQTIDDTNSIQLMPMMATQHPERN